MRPRVELTLTLVLLLAAPSRPAAAVEVYPRELTLSGHRDRARIVVTGQTDDGGIRDRTPEAGYQVENPEIVSVTGDGRVLPKADGTTRILADGVPVKVEVRGVANPRPVSFRHETLPVLSRMGCSSGSCHGAPHGKGGFRLSLRAFDPELDAFTLVQEEFGRRTNPIEPERSLILLKPTTQVSHEGGKKLERDSQEYQLLRDWIAEGCPVGGDDEARCVGIEVYPDSARVLTFPDHRQQFAVRALFDDGSSRDVSHLAVFETSDDRVATVTRSGLVTGIERGDVAVIVRYLEHIESTSLTFVRKIEDFAWTDPPAANYIDDLVHAKLRQLQFAPAPLAGDREFIRRLSLDVTGLLPEPEAVRRFVAD
nr:DUF1549 domain-containing protein [Akkermansiaceae bacterium]